MNDRYQKALARAIKAAGGSQSALARSLNVTPSTVCNWVNERSRPAPLYTVLMAERYGIKRGHLRPDLFGKR